MVFNNYGNGTDDLGIPGRSRIHTDDSIEVRYYNKPRVHGHFEDGVLPDRRCGLRIRTRRELHVRATLRAEAVLPGVDALQPALVR